jgi:hypothetical protein
MADLAHDASGPTSSEPAGIAVREAGGPTSSDKGKPRVFISYSRDDLDFADQVTAALDFSGFECFIDREGISGGEEWKRSLGGLISEADTVVFVLTPNSARSPICDWEVEEATRLNKRILPILCRPLEGVSPTPRLQELNYIFFYKEPKVPGSGFGTGLAKLVTALNTDFDWLRDHTRYLQRAIEWDKGARPANRLLSGDDIAEAKAWVARRPKGAPEPTALQLDFIRASEEEAQARLSEQRKQLEAVAAAQAAKEKALQDREEAVKQRARVARVRNFALVVGSVLAVLAAFSILAYSGARIEQRNTTKVMLEEAEIIIGRLVDRMDFETQHQAFELLMAAVTDDDTATMNILGQFYEKGYGVPQDYTKAREWYQKAAADNQLAGRSRAKNGFWAGLAMNNLGGLFANGQGVPQDYAKAREWLEKAARTLSGVIWLDLIAKEFTKALVVADRAHELFPDDTGIESNRAHALMFLGHDEEAKALYLAHKKEPVSGEINKLWEQVIAEDFVQLRKVGLTNPMMADVEKELGISR